jgi:hypothetical protein
MYSAVLAHYLLNEKLNLFGLLGGMLCVAGSLTIVLHAPEERPITSLLQVWQLALQPGQLSALPHVQRTLTLILAMHCTAVCTSKTIVPDHICFSPIVCMSLLHAGLPFGQTAAYNVFWTCRLSAICGECNSSDSCVHAAHCSSPWHNLDLCLHHYLLFGGLLVSHEL